MTYVKEDEPIGYPIICFTALDFDFGANAIVTYALVSIMSKSNDRIVDPDLFYLDPVSGTTIYSRNTSKQVFFFKGVTFRSSLKTTVILYHNLGLL